MAEKENKFLTSLHKANLIDEREIVFPSDIYATNGNIGRAWWMLNGNILHIYEQKGFTEIGNLIEDIDLDKTVFVKGSSFVLNSNFTIEANGVRYKFTGFPQAKRVISVIRESCKG